MNRFFAFGLLSCLTVGAEQPPAIEQPAAFPEPVHASYHEATTESIALGKRLFHENALSITNTVSCAFCHLPHEAFSDPSNQPWGVRPEQATRRHSMPLFNLAWKAGPFRWDGDEESLREQILRPIEDPLELGGSLTALPAKLAQVDDYPARFAEAFGDSEITPTRLATAIEHYLFTIVAADSKYDRAERGEVEFTPQEEQGKALFFQSTNGDEGLRGAGCAECHPAPLFTNHQFYNNGLAPRRGDKGREEVTGRSEDRYQFVAPSLRNIEITSPYMHDGRFYTLAEVVRHYSDGIRRGETLAPSLAALPPQGGALSDEEQAALVAFLKTLTDFAYLKEEPEVPLVVDDPFAWSEKR